MKYYIASALENADQVKKLKKILDAAGWEHTYDWTVHGSVQTCDPGVIAEVAENEVNGVMMAEVVVVLLRGGRGTHTELGLALAPDPRVGISLRSIYLYSPTPEDDFGTTGKTCAFYHHPDVTQFDDFDEMVECLLGDEV